MKTPPADMLAAAQAILPNAYAPYSHFSVAACIRTEDGALIVGCNVENAAYPLASCAEAGAISTMYAQGHRKIVEALVLVPGDTLCSPCGACRQRLLESSIPNLPIHLCTTDGMYQHTTLSELLPFAFGPKNLEKK